MMKHICLVCFILFSISLRAGDLDDGIAFDEPVQDDLQLDKNIKFITRKSIAKSKQKNPSDSQTGVCGSGNIVIGAGSKVKEVVNVSTNKGTTTVCGN
jgi:hypothetical protein